MSTEQQIKDIIDGFNPKKLNSTSLFLVKRKNSQDPQKKFDISSITIDGEPVDSFANVLKNRLSQIKKDLDSEEIEFKDFYDEAINPEDISELEPDKINGFIPMIEKMEKYDQVRNIKNLKYDQKFDFYAFEFKFDSGRVIYFRKASYKSLIKPDKYRHWLRLLNGKLTRVEGDIFTFDEAVHCVYFEELKSVLVLDKNKTEDMFHFKEYFTKYAIDKLKDLQKKGLIKISSDMLKLENKIHLCKTITGTDKANRFNKTIEDYRKCETFFKDHEGELREDLSQIDIKDDVLNIDTNEKLETFVHLSNRDIVQDILSGELFVALKKSSMKRKKKKK